jgi:eukaryotic-like serine/threonine-protein kinase
MPHPWSVTTRPSDEPSTVPAPVRQWRRAALAALGDDPRRLPPVVDGYAVGALLGSGGSSVVWAGTGVDGVERALKVLHPDTDADLLGELSMQRRVRHPRVVAVHDISTDSAGRPVLVLDLAAGGSLAALVARRRRLSAAEVSGLLSVLGPALEDLHGAGVVHGDIAPGNVLLDARGEPLLADLGVSRALGRTHGSVLGTPGFADPAALAGGGVSAASDVYGLAALAWWALVGEPPVPTGQLAARLSARRPGERGTAAAAVLDSLRDALHRKPSRRPTPGELARAVAAVARPRPVRGLTPSAVALPEPGEVAAPPGATRRLPTPAGPVDPETAPAPASARPSAPTGRRTPSSSAARPGRPARRRAAPPRRRVPRLFLVAAALPVVAGGALVVALQAGAEERPASAPTAAVDAPALPPQDEPTPEETVPVEVPVEVPDGAAVLRGEDPVAVVAELADRRARALVAGDAAALDLVDVAGSGARTADEAVLAELAGTSSRFEALAFDVRAVREVSRAEQWVLEADVVTAEHVVVSAGGARTTVPAGEPRTSRLTLERVQGEWRIAAVG